MSCVKGVVVPILTPIYPDETPNYGQLAALTEYVIAGGIDAVFVNGTSGEFARFSVVERDRCLETVVRTSNGRVPVIAGVSDCGTRLVIENAGRAAELGADAVVTTLPYYFPTASPREQRQFIGAVLDASPKPVFLYNIPSIIGCNIDAAALRAVMGHPNLCGIKDTSGDGALLASLIDICGESAGVFVGDERLIYHGLREGAAGLVPSLANPFPRLLRDVWRAARSSSWDVCRELCGIVDGMNALNGFCDSWMAPNIWRKEALCQMGIIDATFTSPHNDMGDDDKARVSHRVEQYREYCKQ